MPRKSPTPGLVRPSEGSSNLLAAVCGWFTEVFETLGLKEANARLAFCAGCGRTSAGASASCVSASLTMTRSYLKIADRRRLRLIAQPVQPQGDGGHSCNTRARGRICRHDCGKIEIGEVRF